MITKIGLSNFSFRHLHFSSFDELKNEFIHIQDFFSGLKQCSLVAFMGNDIATCKLYGLSLEEQIKNFDFGSDVGLVAYFYMKLHQSYLNGFDLSLSTEQLLCEASLGPNLEMNANFILYSPLAVVSERKYFSDEGSFRLHYEDILGRYPTSNQSYYERMCSHFDNLIFHQYCRSTLDKVSDGFCNYSIAFTKCLKVLNEFDPASFPSNKGRLAAIQAKSGYECTEEGKSDPKFTFNFSFNGLAVDINCQFHLKPSDKNLKGDTSYNFKRLYFGFLPATDGRLKIAIASIGPHL